MPFLEKAVLPDDLIQKFMQELSLFDSCHLRIVS